MRKLLVALLLISLSFPAHADERESAFDRVTRTGTLRCAYASVGTPIHKDLKTNEIVGPVADIAREMAALLKLNIEWTTEVGYGDFAEGFRTGRYDAFCGILSLAPTRARVAAFTTPTFYMPYYIYTRADDKRFTRLEDLNNKDVRAGAVDGEIFQIMTRKHFPLSQEYSKPNMTPSGELFVDMANDKADFVLHDTLIFRDFDENNPGKVRRAFSQAVETSAMGFAVGPTELALQNMLNTAIDNLHLLGKIDDILNRYKIGEDIYRRVAQPFKTPGAQ